MTQEATDIVRIGAGSFATVYTWQGRNNVAIKCVADPSRCAELLREYEAHRAVHGAAGDSIFEVPAAGSHYPSYSKFKQDLGLEADPMGDTVCMYTMERVWPIPHVMSARIKNLYFPEEHKRYPKHFIARVYLGRDPERNKQLYASRFFNANNFPLDAERCEQLQLPVRMLAEGMGRLLARIHYWTGMDGRDIEFVLGGHWKQTLTEHAFFCFDFNQMKPHGDSVKRLVDSFFSNDPYYPRPGLKLLG